MATSVDELPIWQREPLFPAKPTQSDYGLYHRNSEPHFCHSWPELERALSDTSSPDLLIWTPGQSHCFPAEEEPRLLPLLKEKKEHVALKNWQQHRLRAFLGLLPFFYFLLKGLLAEQLLQSPSAGLITILWIVFAGLPAYEAWKKLRKARSLDAPSLEQEAQEIRFETWQERQKAHWTKALLSLFLIGFAAQTLHSLVEGQSFWSALWLPLEIIHGQFQYVAEISAFLSS